MNKFYTELSRYSFQITFKKKINQQNFFKFAEKYFNSWKWNIVYEKENNLIEGKRPFMKYLDKNFPIKLPFYLKNGLRKIIIKKMNSLNSYSIEVVSGEIIGNTAARLVCDFFTVEINKKFDKLKVISTETISKVIKKQKISFYLLWGLAIFITIFIAFIFSRPDPNRSRMLEQGYGQYSHTSGKTSTTQTCNYRMPDGEKFSFYDYARYNSDGTRTLLSCPKYYKPR